MSVSACSEPTLSPVAPPVLLVVRVAASGSLPAPLFQPRINRPRRSGRLKVLPLAVPNAVPMALKRVVYVDRDTLAPLQKRYPEGAVVPPYQKTLPLGWEKEPTKKNPTSTVKIHRRRHNIEVE